MAMAMAMAMAMEQAPSGRIVHPAGDGIVFGPGVVAERLGGLLARTGIGRPLIVTTPSVVRAGLVDHVVGALGVDPVGRFDRSQEHTPAPAVLAAAAAARDGGADGLVSVGGSSVVDLAKGVALVLSSDARLEGPDPARRPTFGRAPLPHIAVTTTLSGAEFTPAAGITDPESGEKRSYVDPGLAPRWVVLDPEMTRATPPALWAATGMKLLADAVEMLCSTRATPLSDALAPVALEMLGRDLAVATAAPDDRDARGRCQLAAALLLPYLVGVGAGLVAALRHQLGGGLGVGHGIASTIVLPRVVDWNASAAGPALDRAAAALGVSGADGLVGRIEALTAELGLPPRLRDVGVTPGDFTRIADHVLADGAVRTNPRPVTGASDVLAVLEAAY